MAFDLAGARAAGYSDDEIATALGERAKFDTAGALRAGYSAQEVVDLLSQKAAAPTPAGPTPLPANGAEPVQTMDSQGTPLVSAAPSAPGPAATDVLDRAAATPISDATMATYGRLSRRANAEASAQPAAERRVQFADPGREVQPRSVAGAVGDTVLAAGQGALSVAKGIASNVGAGDNVVSSTLGDAITGLDYMKSDQLRNTLIQRDGIVQAALRSSGETGAARAAFNTAMSMPGVGADVAARGAGSLLPMIGIAGRLGLAGERALNMLANAGDAAQQTADGLRKMGPAEWARDPQYKALLDAGLSHEQAVGTLAPVYALPAQAIGALTGWVSGGTGVERVFAGRAAAGGRAAVGRVAAEIGGEQAETLVPQAVGNVTQGAIDGRTVWNEGFGQAAVDTALGTGPGAAMAATGGRAPAPAPIPTARELVRDRLYGGRMPAAPAVPTVPTRGLEEIAAAQTVDQAIAAAADATSTTAVEAIDDILQRSGTLPPAPPAATPPAPPAPTTGEISAPAGEVATLPPPPPGTAAPAIDETGIQVDKPGIQVDTAAPAGPPDLTNTDPGSLLLVSQDPTHPLADAARAELTRRETEAAYRQRDQQVEQQRQSILADARDQQAAQATATGQAQELDAPTAMAQALRQAAGPAGAPAAPAAPAAQLLPRADGSLVVRGPLAAIRARLNEAGVIARKDGSALIVPRPHVARAQAALEGWTPPAPPPAPVPRLPAPNIAVDAAGVASSVDQRQMARDRLQQLRDQRRGLVEKGAAGGDVIDVPARTVPEPYRDPAITLSEIRSQRIDAALARQGAPDAAASAQAREDAAAARQRQSAGGNAAREGARADNPMRAFLGEHGISLDVRKDFVPGATEQRQSMVRGYGPVFRRNGMPLDQLAQRAVDEGFLLEPDVPQLESLISRALAGERIIPQYAAGAAESEMGARVAQQRQMEEDAARRDVAELPGDALDALSDAADQADWPTSNISEADAMRLLGFTEEEIAHETANGSEAAPRPGEGGAVAEQAGAGAAEEGAAGRAGETRPPSPAGNDPALNPETPADDAGVSASEGPAGSYARGGDARRGGEQLDSADLQARVAAYEARVAKILRHYPGAPRVRVAATPAGVTPPRDGSQHPADMRGYHDGNTIWIVAGTQAAYEIPFTLAHELVGHHGFEGTLREAGAWDQYVKNMQLALKGGNPELRDIRDMVRRSYTDEQGAFNLSPDREAAEMGAHAAELAVDPKTGEFRPQFSWLGQVVAKVRSWLRAIGISVPLSRNDLMVMLAAADQRMRKTPVFEGLGSLQPAAAARSGAPQPLPDAIIGNTLGSLTSHPDYPAAKAGDLESAARLARDVVTDEMADRVRAAIGDTDPIVVPVISVEEAGRNKIPRAAAVALAQKLGLERATGIVQANRPKRTTLDGLDRIFAAPEFDGPVEAGRNYLLLDDTLTQGATFAALADHIRKGGGHVVGALALTGKQYSAKLAPTPETLQQLRDKHGDLENDFRAATGYGFGHLTQSEARYLANYKPAEALRARIVEEAGRRGRPGAGGDAGQAGGVEPSYARGSSAAAAAAQAAESAEPPARARPIWRDATGRFHNPAGQKLYDLLGKAADPLLVKMGFKSASPALKRQLRQMKLEVQQAQETAQAVAKESFKLSDAERAMVSDIIEKELEAGTVPPVHAVRLAGVMNDAMGRQTAELIRLGMMTEEAAERWGGKYLPRYYESKLLPKPLQDTWEAALRGLIRRPSAMKGIKGKHLRGRGLFETIPAADLEAYQELGWEVRDPDFDPKKDSTVQVWRDFTPAERNNMGEIRDAGMRFVLGYMQTQRDIALGRFFERLANDPEQSSRTQEEGMVQVPDTKVPGTGAHRYGKLAGRWVLKETMSHLSQIEESQSEAWKLYRSAMALWKEGKTALNPVSHVNNIVSNLTMAHLAGVSYWQGHKYVAAARDFAVKDSPGIKEAKEAGLFLGTLSEAELLDTLPPELKRLVGQTDSGLKKSLISGKWSAFNLMTLMLRKPMGAAYQAEDTFFRYLLYKDARDRGLEPQDAVDYAQRFIFTYDDLPKGARMVRDFGLPFFSYTYKAVPALLHTALTHPVRMATPAALLWGINAAAYAIAAGDDDDSWVKSLSRYLNDPAYRDQVREKEKLEREHLPPWMKGMTAFATPKTLRLGTDEVTKLPLFIDIARVIPGGDLFDVSPNASGVPLPQPITPSHPLLTTLTAMLANKDLYFGKDLVDSNDTRGEASEKRLKWLWSQFTPAVAAGNYHFDRGMNALAQASGGEIRWLPDAVSERYTGVGRDGLPVQPGLAAMQTFGIKVRPIDLDLSEQMDASQQRKLARDIDAEMRSLQRLNRKGAISDRVLEKARDQAQVKKERLREGLTVDGDARP